MRESVWGYAIITLGILAIGIIWFFANVTRTDQHNYNLLKETVESAMLDSVDLSAYREDGTVKIVEEKFVENFIRRFSENADLSNAYLIEIFDVNETPPKVSLRVSSIKSTTYSAGKGEIVTFDIVNNIDAILEESYEESDRDEADDVVGENKTSCIVTNKNCTIDNRCSYTQHYISNNGFPNTTCSDKTIKWSIYTEDFKLPEQIKNEALNLGKAVSDIVFYPKSVSWINATLTQSDLDNYAAHFCDWYTGYRDSDGKLIYFKPSDCINKEAVSVYRLAKIENASFELSGNILNVEVESKCTDKIREFETTGSKGYSVSSKYSITFEYYFK